MNRQVTDEQQYLDLLESIVDAGYYKGDRTGTGTFSKFGQVMRFDLTDKKIPLLTTKRMYHRSFIHETLWFISGSTDINYLKDHGISIWDSWVIPETAVYRTLSDEEIVKEISTHYGAPAKYWHYIAVTRDGRQGFEYVMYTETPADGIGIPCAPGTSLEDLYEDTFQRKPKVLVSGSIGPGAYGAMWRNIEDTRIVDRRELGAYSKKGFTVAGNLLTEQSTSAVVTRKIDQLQNAIDLLRTNPDSRRIIIHTFDNRMVDFCALPPCHSFYQFLTRELRLHERVKWFEKNDPKDMAVFRAANDWTAADNTVLEDYLDRRNVPKRALTCLLYQRSMDTPVGAPFNFSQYSLLTHMVAQITGMVAEEFVHFAGDAHVYADQVDLVKEQIERPIIEQTARLVLNPEVKEIDDFTFEDIQIAGYDNHHPAIKYPVAV